MSLNIFHASQAVCKRSAANATVRCSHFFHWTCKTKQCSLCTSKEAVHFFTLILHFLHCWKSLFCNAKIALFWLFSASSRSSLFFTLELENEAVQNRTDLLGPSSPPPSLLRREPRKGRLRVFSQIRTIFSYHRERITRKKELSWDMSHRKDFVPQNFKFNTKWSYHRT